MSEVKDKVKSYRLEWDEPFHKQVKVRAAQIGCDIKDFIYDACNHYLSVTSGILPKETSKKGGNDE